MSVWGVLRILARRWYVVVPVLAVGCVLAYMKGKGVAPTYDAQAYVTLQGPTEVVQTVPGQPTQTQTVPVNPLLNSGSAALAPEAARLVLIESSNISRLDAVKAGVSPAYTITAQARSSLMVIDSSTSSDALSLATVRFGISHLQKSLDADQQGFLNKPTQRVTLQTLIPAEIVAVKTSGKTRTELVIAALAAVLGIVLALLLEAALIGARNRRRRKRNRAHRAVGSPADQVDPTEADDIPDRAFAESSEAESHVSSVHD